MFDNIGRKIMMLAKIVCWIGIIGGAISGLVLLCISDGDELFIWLGLALMFVSPLLSWIGSWFLYSWGELCDNVSDITYYESRRPVSATKGGSTTSKPSTIAVNRVSTTAVGNPYNRAQVAIQKPVLSPEAKNLKLKELLQKGLITQDEYNVLINK
jgi:hypothetical protein